MRNKVSEFSFEYSIVIFLSQTRESWTDPPPLFPNSSLYYGGKQYKYNIFFENEHSK